MAEISSSWLVPGRSDGPAAWAEQDRVDWTNLWPGLEISCCAGHTVCKCEDNRRDVVDTLGATGGRIASPTL